jgi:hypothetical protein
MSPESIEIANRAERAMEEALLICRTTSATFGLSPEQRERVERAMLGWQKAVRAVETSGQAE